MNLRKRIDNLLKDKVFSDILTGSFWAVLGSIMGLGLGFIVSLIIARKYGAGVLGTVSVLNSFFGIVTLFTVLGTSTSLLRMIPEHFIRFSPKSAYSVYKRVGIIIITTSLVIGTFTFIFSELLAVNIFSKPHLAFYLKISALFIIFKSFSTLNTETIRGLKLKKPYALMQFIPKLFNLIFLFLFVFLFTKDDVPIYALFGEFLFTALIGAIIVQSVFKKKIKSTDVVCSVSSKKILSISLPMLMGQASYFLMANMGVLLLGVFRTEEEVGFFSIALSLAMLTNFSIKAINSVAAPNFSELFHSGQINEMFYIAQKSAKLIFWTTLPIITMLIILGKFIIEFVYGTDFSVAYVSLVLLAIGQFVNAISGATGTILNMTGNEKILQNIMIVATLLNLLMNLLLIPQYGMNGAAISTLVTIVFWNLVSVMYIKKKYKRITGYLPFFKIK